MPVFIPIGHGMEFFQRPNKILIPDGCTLTTIETPGGVHVGDDGLFEHSQIVKFISIHPELRNIFDSPKENISILNKILRSVAVYTAGSTCPDLQYQLCAKWGDPKIINIRYSGLIQFDNFVNPEFNLTNIIKTFPENFTTEINEKSIENISEWCDNMRALYKFSIYPSPDDYTRVFSTPAAMRDFLIERGIPEKAKIIQEHMDTNTPLKLSNYRDVYNIFSGVNNATAVIKGEHFDEVAKNTFIPSNPIMREGYINVSLISLMKQFPGNYIHIVCRATNESMVWPQMPNPNAEFNRTIAELSTKRLPFFTNTQRNRAIAHIKWSLQSGKKSKFNKYSTKNTRNVMLGILEKLLAQKEMSKGVHLKPVAATERENEVTRNANGKPVKRAYHNTRWNRNANKWVPNSVFNGPPAPRVFSEYNQPRLPRLEENDHMFNNNMNLTVVGGTRKYKYKKRTYTAKRQN